MEYHLGGCRKTYLLLRVTPLFLPGTLLQASRTNIFRNQPSLLTYVLHTGLTKIFIIFWLGYAIVRDASTNSATGEVIGSPKRQA